MIKIERRKKGKVGRKGGERREEEREE